MNDAAAVTENLAHIGERIAAVGGTDVEILAVTKGFGPEVIAVAAAAGCLAIGESYAQELLRKADAVRATPMRVHFIGQLQTNKVRQLAGLVQCYASVDRPRLVHEIAKRDAGASILLQVDTSALTGSDAAGKGGWPIADLDELIQVARDSGLDVQGLMTVGPTDGGPSAARPGFDAVRSAVERHRLGVCSMGMTDDLEVAVECGSTQVRIGTALFGSRPVPKRDDQGR